MRDADLKRETYRNRKSDHICRAISSKRQYDNENNKPKRKYVKPTKLTIRQYISKDIESK